MPRSLFPAIVSLAALLHAGALRADEVRLEQTFYYDGNMGGKVPFKQPAIDVDADGTVAVGINRTVQPGNAPGHSWLVLLYDKNGEPIGQAASQNSTMVDVCFGPDGRVYTAEAWFGSGVHVYDRPGAKERYVPARFIRTGGYHPDHGNPRGVAVGPDMLIYSTAGTKQYNKHLIVTKPDGTLVKALPMEGADRVDVGPDGTVYDRSRFLGPDDTWQQFKYDVRDIRPDGIMLVSGREGWAIYDPKADRVLKEIKYPPGNWRDIALGPDDNLYLAPQNRPDTNPDLAYVVANPDGEIILRRGADFDRITVTLPDSALAAGEAVTISAQTTRSRDLGLVPESVQLPFDNRPELLLTAALAPVIVDPLRGPWWTECTLAPIGNGQYNLGVPAGLHGTYYLKCAATREIPGLQQLAVITQVTIQPEGAAAFLQPKTDRNRTGFVAGSDIRLTVPIRPADEVDLSRVRLALTLDGRPAWEAPLGLGKVAGGAERTAVVRIPAAVTRRLRPAVYEARVVNLPAGAASGRAVVHIVGSVPTTLFQTLLHPIGNSYGDPINDAKMHAQMGATHVVSPTRWDGTYLDIATRLGFTFHFQPHGHYSPLNTLPQEHGAARQYIAALAQRMRPYPCFRGFNYHDLQVQPWGGWGDARGEFYGPLWAEWAREVNVPDTVPADLRRQFAENVAQESMLDRLYKELGEAISHVDDGLDRTTMQWWHQPLTIASPDHVSAYQNLISTQHMEEQYYHAVTVANQADLWRRPGKSLWVYGNTSWQEDGTGASMYTDFMAALCRGVQGVGRNELPRTGDLRSERIHRTATPAFRLLHKYGGLSAAAEPDDKLAIWRSFYQSCAETQRGKHLTITTAAYTACLYGHRTAGIITDDLVRVGHLGKYEAVIVNFDVPLPPDLAGRLKEFQDAGGLVLSIGGGERNWRPPGAIELDPAPFQQSHALAHSNRDSLRHIGIEEDGLRGAPVIKLALGDKARPVADCQDPTTWISVLKSGDARYVYTVNLKRLPHDPMDLHRFSGYENTRMPAKTQLRLEPGDYVIYDVFAGREVAPEKEEADWFVEADMSVFPGAIFALLPGRIDQLAVRSTQVTRASSVSVAVEVNDDEGRVISGAIPLEITVADARGKLRHHLYRTAAGPLFPEAEEWLRVAANELPGRWTITVTELLSGKQVSGSVRVEPPELPEAQPAPPVEWGRRDRITQALQNAQKVALVASEEQIELLAPAIESVEELLAKDREAVDRISTADYLADRKELLWDRFRFGSLGTAEIKRRSKKYDLIVAFDVPDLPGGVIEPDTLPIPFSRDDPGPGRGLIQFAAMPVYDTEDAVSLAGGDLIGLMAAAEALGRVEDAPGRAGTSIGRAKELGDAKQRRAVLPGLREFIGIPISEVAASRDGSRVAAGLKGWGNHLFFLDGNGRIISKELASKFFPLDVKAAGDGFCVLTHGNDPTTLYLTLHDRNGKAQVRLAAPGRRVGGMRDWSASQPEVIDRFLKQASFSITPDGRFAAVGGSKAIAVWDLRNRKVIWRDDTIHYDKGGFPQLKLSPDGTALTVQHDGTLFLRDGRTGKLRTTVSLPVGASMGRVRVFDGHLLVVGDSEFFAFRDDEPLWYWKAPKTVTATAFADDGLRYAVGEVDGTVRLMTGGGEVGGYVPPDGGMITALDLQQGTGRVAFAAATGWVGVLDSSGRILWQQNVGARPVIAFAGEDGDTVVGDWRGILRRFSKAGAKLWEADLTPLVYRADAATLLTTLDTTPTLRLAPPEAPEAVAPEGRPNLAPSATVTLVKPRSWWNQPQDPDRSVSLTDGMKTAPEGGWFDRTKLEYAAFCPSPPAWEFTWKEPVTVSVLAAYESPEHPEAVPEEVKIEAWVNEGWKEVVHEYWNRGVVHAHQFDPVTTTRIRYTPMGDLAGNVWLSEIEIYAP